MSNLPKWPIFLTIPEQLVEKVTNVYVFGANGEEMLFVTSESKKSLDLYRTKLDVDGCSKIATFNGNGVKIVDIVVSPMLTIFVLTNTCLYAWGNNANGQVGNGQSTGTVEQPFVVSEDPKLKDETIVQIAAGSNHCVCLTSSGHIYAWGSNQYGQVGASSAFTPTLFSPEKLKDQTITRVYCCSLTTFALDSEGRLFGWGYNDGSNRVLGTSSCSSSSTPILIGGDTVFKDVVIKEIACGPNYVLALTPGGTVFAWGSNQQGQLGLKHQSDVVEPMRIAAFDQPRVRVATLLTSYNNKKISVARSVTGETYIWGETRLGILTAPKKIPPSDSCVNAFCDWTVLPLVTPNLVKAENVQLLGEMTAVPSWLRESFDNADAADIKFFIQGRIISAHKTFLSARSTFFRKMFAEDRWRESKEGQVTIQHYSYDVYRALLYYFYTNEVNIPEGTSPEDVLSLYDLANSYFEEELKHKACDFFLKKWLNLDNVIPMYALAADHPIEHIAAACMELILENLSTLVKSEAFGKLSSSHAKNIFLMSANRNLLKS